ncbi:hypothetical protein ACFFX0_11360 [Citricoccus parietis]|uniref:Uncharacterized protein n=1 Tax=Citricoccus parietis TaxID=592307 RepID=A0ABV5FYK5_9MICC
MQDRRADDGVETGAVPAAGEEADAHVVPFWRGHWRLWRGRGRARADAAFRGTRAPTESCCPATAAAPRPPGTWQRR